MKKFAILAVAIILIILGFYYFSGNNEFPAPLGLPAQADLPAPVEAKRQAIFVAAQSRDYEELTALAEPTVNYTFGGEVPGGFAEFLKTSDSRKQSGEQDTFETITALLKLPHSQLLNIYVWPSAFTKVAETWTEEDIAQMKKLLSDEQIEGYRKFGAYAYYRLGIREDGAWIYYVAGD